MEQLLENLLLQIRMAKNSLPKQDDTIYLDKPDYSFPINLDFDKVKPKETVLLSTLTPIELLQRNLSFCYLNIYNDKELLEFDKYRDYYKWAEDNEGTHNEWQSFRVVYESTLILRLISSTSLFVNSNLKKTEYSTEVLVRLKNAYDTYLPLNVIKCNFTKKVEQNFRKGLINENHRGSDSLSTILEFNADGLERKIISQTKNDTYSLLKKLLPKNESETFNSYLKIKCQELDVRYQIESYNLPKDKVALKNHKKITQIFVNSVYKAIREDFKLFQTKNDIIKQLEKITKLKSKLELLVEQDRDYRGNKIVKNTISTLKDFINDLQLLLVYSKPLIKPNKLPKRKLTLVDFIIGTTEQDRIELLSTILSITNDVGYIHKMDAEKYIWTPENHKKGLVPLRALMKVLFDYKVLSPTIKDCSSGDVMKLLKEHISFEKFTEASVCKALQSFAVAEDLNEKYSGILKKAFFKIRRT
jgi:HrpA-like RNA helicase